MTNLTFASVEQLAQMIRDRDVSAVEVVEAYLTQIAQHNPKLNAICTLDEDNALDSPLAKAEGIHRRFQAISSSIPDSNNSS